jgi:hypothetical protein
MLSSFVAARETALKMIEATRVITPRMQILLQGGKAAEADAVLMVTKKMKAFYPSGVIAGGASLAHVQANFQSDIRANYDLLSATRKPVTN